jgi:aryl-alcohol dehydrogenase-like predicted oxidoreductase
MDYIKLSHSDLTVSKICLGTMTFGDQNSQAEAFNQLDYAMSQGINFIDTAEMYPVPPKAETYTRTEGIVGNWLKHQPRDKIILGSKVAGPGRGMHWIRNEKSVHDGQSIREAVEGSLKRLQTDYIDLYQLHWPARNVPLFGQYAFDPDKEFISGKYNEGDRQDWTSIRNQLETLSALTQEGKIRYIGLSNEQPWGVMQFLQLAKEYNLPRVSTLQNCYNLINRGMEFGMTEILFREEVSLLAYSPLAFGHLTAKYIDNPEAKGRVTQFLGYAQRYNKPNVIPASKAYAKIAREHQLSPAQLALSFVYHRWFVSSTIIGATSMPQLEENIAAWKVKLTPEIMQEIEGIHLRMMNPAP